MTPYQIVRATKNLDNLTVYLLTQRYGYRMKGLKVRHIMQKTTCPVCKGVGHTTEDDFPTVCPDCQGVGEITLRSYGYPPLAKFAGSLTGMAGGTVIRELANRPPKKP
jgi:hypothetical protein